MTNQPEEAEDCYRRAYAIAAASLEADHPFVLTSRKNLTDFCEARGKPVDLSPPAQAAGSVPTADGQLNEEPQAPMRAPTSAVAPAPEVHRAANKSALRLGMAVVGAIVVLLVIGTVMRRSPDRAVSSVANAPAPTPQEGDTAPSPVPVPSPAKPAASAVPATPRSGDPVGSSDRPSSPARSGKAARPVVASAALCTRFSTTGSNWRCDPAGRTVDRGSLVYYTRIKTPSATTVQHRWYRGNALYQSVDLRVLANQVDGYRTYSRYTPKAGAEGEWRVELRATDGTLLHEERFSVR
jgi:hypothetical protein